MPIKTWFPRKNQISNCFLPDKILETSKRLVVFALILLKLQFFFYVKSARALFALPPIPTPPG